MQNGGGLQLGELVPSQNNSEYTKPCTRKANNKVTTGNGHTGHCTHTLENTNVEVQKI